MVQRVFSETGRLYVKLHPKNGPMDIRLSFRRKFDAQDRRLAFQEFCILECVQFGFKNIPCFPSSYWGRNISPRSHMVSSCCPSLSNSHTSGLRRSQALDGIKQPLYILPRNKSRKQTRSLGNERGPRHLNSDLFFDLDNKQTANPTSLRATP